MIFQRQCSQLSLLVPQMEKTAIVSLTLKSPSVICEEKSSDLPSLMTGTICKDLLLVEAANCIWLCN